jgi:hypothetical protein
MTKEEFKSQYNEILARALAVNEKRMRYGPKSLEENINYNESLPALEKEKCGKKDPFEYGMRLMVDGKEAEEIEPVLDEVVNKETDSDKKKLLTIKKEAIMAIIREWNTRLVLYLINSLVSLEIHDLSKEDDMPDLYSLCPDPKDAEYEIYECAEGFIKILDMDDHFIQRLMRELDSQELAIAIRHTEKELKDVFFRNMSEKAVEMLWEDMDYLGDVEPERVIEYQQKIVEIINALKAEEI